MIEAIEGDDVVMSFANRIPGEVSTIHWHGMSVPADQDGNPMDPVGSGSDRTYSFALPEGSAGTYWYHPHPHGLTAKQVYLGLAGPVIVKPKVDPIPAAYGDTVLLFTDLRLGPDGKLPESTMVDLMNGRVGDHVLVNGQKILRRPSVEGEIVCELRRFSQTLPNAAWSVGATKRKDHDRENWRIFDERSAA